MKKNILYLFFVIFLTRINAQIYKLESPDNAINIAIDVGKELSFSVTNKGSYVMKVSNILLNLKNGNKLGLQPKLKKKNLS
tara:strand:- start:1577 stop:1819 length:243 start_codon:yes stop_codon:yes gene_type:complete